MKISVYIFCRNLLEREIYGEILAAEGFNPILPVKGRYTNELIYPKIRNKSIVLTDISDKQISKYLKLKKESRSISVVCIGPVENIGAIRSFYKSGGSGFVSYNNSANELVECLSYLAKKGSKFITQELKTLLTTQLYEAPPASLTDREAEIVKHVKNGLTSREIADILLIHYRTVEGYRYRILKKFNVGNSASLISYLHHKISA